MALNTESLLPISLVAKESSAKPLKKYSIRHKRMLALYLQGHSPTQIATALGCAPSTVSAVVHNPRSKEVIESAISHYDLRLKALQGPAIDTLKDAMEGEDMRCALEAAKIILKSQGKMDKPAEVMQGTAEDIVQEIYKIEGDGKVNITIGKQKLRRVADREVSVIQ
jgi:predicted transcriptional regulator